MKILASSPYAAFNVNEWNSLTKSCKKNNQNNLFKLKGNSYGEFKKYNSRKSYKTNTEKQKLIQLSFA
tara:strand:+ start:108 stop:311 length:204 start_codon:yes stop_codon:yes gene_type:complete